MANSFERHFKLLALHFRFDLWGLRFSGGGVLHPAGLDGSVGRPAVLGGRPRGLPEDPVTVGVDAFFVCLLCFGLALAKHINDTMSDW